MENLKSVMDKIDNTMATLDVHFNKEKKYKECNTTFPKELPPICFLEAERAYKLLVRKFGKKKDAAPSRLSNMKIRRWRKVGDKVWKTRVRKCWIALSGNTSDLSRGWRRLTHDVSHMVYSYRNPKVKFHHSYQQANLELDIIKFVISKGWLNGTLKPKVRVLSRNDKFNIKVESTQNLIKSWKTKQARANNKLKKLQSKLKRLQKSLAH
tara:strand:- start:10 stop:639 length:630 start_codon:yes stop_codon:yes gene_type:complete